MLEKHRRSPLFPEFDYERYRKMKTTMETNTVQFIELLSLEARLDGCFMALRVTRNEGRTECVMEIDKPTYAQMSAVIPSSGERVRLSLHPKWDPYRSVHYSTAIKVNGSFNETLYFTCSELYIAQLNRLREDDGAILHSAEASAETAKPRAAAAEEAKQQSAAAEEARQRAAEAETAKQQSAGAETAKPRAAEAETAKRQTAAAEEAKPQTAAGAAMEVSMVAGRPTQRVQRMGPLALKFALFTLLASFIIMGVDGKLFNGPEHVLNPPVDAAQPADSADSRKTLESSSEQAITPAALDNQEKSSQLPLSPAAQNVSPVQDEGESPFYKLLSIDDGKFTYGLPKGYVALTFDDGPSVYTKQIVDMLTEQKVAASFLFVGKKAQQFPDAVAYADEHGMTIGNHSWDHTKLTSRNQKSYKNSINKATKTLEALTDKPVTLFRPPYGAIDAALAANVLDEGMKVLMWNRDPEDWKADKPDDILRYFRKIDPSGGIYVLHEKAATVEALPDIIQYLKDEQLTFIIFD